MESPNWCVRLRSVLVTGGQVWEAPGRVLREEWEAWGMGGVREHLLKEQTAEPEPEQCRS